MSSVSADKFKAFGRCIASSVFIVTATDREGKAHGATISASTSLSLSPPLILICLAHTSNTLTALRDSSYFRLHVLSSDQRDISQSFASKDPAKGVSLTSSRDRSGAPILDGALAAAECRVVSEFSVGDHSIVVGALDDISFGDGEPLMYHQGAYTKLMPALEPA